METNTAPRNGVSHRAKETASLARVGLWSTGQKQFLCLSRAIVRGGRVLTLDEITSRYVIFLGLGLPRLRISESTRKLTDWTNHSVDRETAYKTQDIIDVEFKECTILAVLYRLEHVSRYAEDPHHCTQPRFPDRRLRRVLG